MLSKCRVLDLSSERAFLCGQILGDLGADVIKVEPVGGSPARGLGPFVGDRTGPENSIPWIAFNRNKRGITLNPEHLEGRRILHQLVARADFLIESENPGEMTRKELDYARLREVNPALVYVSVTPFGQDGPKAGYADSDLIIMAAGGVLVLYGDEDRPPIRMSVPQAYLHASADAAFAALIAYYERLQSGLGQQVDVAAQESIGLAGQSTALSTLIGGEDTRRMAGGVKMGEIRVPLVWECKDGLVSTVFLFGPALGVFSHRLVEYMFGQGACDQSMKDADWIGYGAKLLSGEESMEGYARARAVIAAFLKKRTKAELFEVARQHNLLIAPIATLADVRQNPQFIAREYWQRMAHPNGVQITYPGPFARFGKKPIAYSRPAPTVGEHNREVLGGELGLDDGEIGELARKGIT
jgi:crotonobetainyl-CoA:carnitine CoA-transferase CaiB-like acyl-CoA transferase